MIVMGINKEQRLRLIQAGNQMAARCWQRYQATLDEKHAQVAEWWREQVERALDGGAHA